MKVARHMGATLCIVLLISIGQVAFGGPGTVEYQAPGRSSPSTTEIPLGAALLVLEPFVTFEWVTDEAALHVADDQLAKVKSALDGAARQALQTRGIRPHQSGGPGEEIAKTVAGLGARSTRLARGQLPDDVRSLLTGLASSGQEFLILAQYLRVKVGPGGSWDPTTGAIRSDMSSAELHSALIGCADGRVLWRNAVVIRRAVRPEDRGFQEEIRRFFASLASGNQRKDD